MNRKEFLAVLGFGVASVLGFSSIIKLLTGRENPLHKHIGNNGGFGGGDYGYKSSLTKKV